MRLERKASSWVECIYCETQVQAEAEFSTRDPVAGDVVRILEGAHKGKMGTVRGDSIMPGSFRVQPQESSFVFPYTKVEIVILPDALEIASQLAEKRAIEAGWRKTTIGTKTMWACPSCIAAITTEN